MGGTAVGADQVNLRVAFWTRIESELPAIRRPAGVAGNRAAKVRQLRLVAALAITDPKFSTAGSIGLENDLLSVRREAWVLVPARGSD